MSSWLDNQRQKAFKVWKIHLALGLHYRDDSGAYDYAKYHGGTSATLEGFLKKPPGEIGPFIKLANKLESRGIDPVEFIFANIVSDQSTYIKVLSEEKAFDTYEGWKLQKGTAEAFDSYLMKLMATSKIPIKFGDDTLANFALEALANKDLHDIVVFILAKNPGLENRILELSNDNIMYKIRLDLLLKRVSVYRYLNII